MAAGLRTTSCSSTWGPVDFEDLCAALTIALGIVSTWNLALFEDTQNLARVVLLIVSAGACLLRQRCEDCDKGAKRGANHGLKSSIFRIDETFRCMRGLFSRNNKTAFQQVECRFAGNPLYQPGIWAPSRTISLGHDPSRQLYQPGIWTPSRTLISAIKSRYRLYQPEIWTPSRTFRPLSFQGHYFINLGSEFLRGSCGNTLSRFLYCISLESGTLRGHIILTFHIDAHCINLESGTFRGQSRASWCRGSHCINLRPGHLRGLRY